MTRSIAARSVRPLLVVVAVAASALGAACGNPVGPREAATAPRASVQAVAPANQASTTTTPKSDSTAATPAPENGAYSGGGSLPWY